MITNSFALLTSKSFVIKLNANSREHCDNPDSDCFIHSIQRLKSCFGEPVRIISHSIENSNVKSLEASAITNYIDTLEDLREAEFAYESVSFVKSYEPENQEVVRLFHLSQQAVRSEKKSKKLKFVFPVQNNDDTLKQLQRFSCAGVVAVHICLLGLGTCTVEEIRSIPGIALVYPTWVTLQSNLRDKFHLPFILKFIQKRHNSHSELIFEDCLSLASYHDHHVDELKQMQNIPAWEWGRIAIVHAWIRQTHPNSIEVRHACELVGLTERYAVVLGKLGETCRVR